LLGDGLEVAKDEIRSGSEGIPGHRHLLSLFNRLCFLFFPKVCASGGRSLFIFELGEFLGFFYELPLLCDRIAAVSIDAGLLWLGLPRSEGGEAVNIVLVASFGHRL
jgi:hypothetical protein